MLVAVPGYKGMLGKRVVDECLAQGFTVYKPEGHFLQYDRGELIGCDAIINCIGAVPQRHADRMKAVESNAYAPHWLAQFRVPMLHISTDCVFNGNLDMGRSYSTRQVTDAITDYGRSKALGESVEPWVCNVRTSFIGPEHGLMKWLIDQPEGSVVSGWFNTAWSGSTVEQVAISLVQMVPRLVEGEYNNIEHLATLEPMRKYDLLRYLSEKYNPTIRVSSDMIATPINRALEPTIVMLDVYQCLK